MINIFKKNRTYNNPDYRLQGFDLADRNFHHNSEQGFTVIEFITAAFIFSIVLITSVGIYLRVLNLQRWAYASQKIQENVLQLMELISKDVRVSEFCPDTTTCTMANFNILHPDKGFIYFSLDNQRGVIVKREGGINLDMTSSEVYFTKFDFIVEGDGCDDAQPKVTLVSTVSDNLGLLSFNLQTTITGRDIREELLLCN